MICGFSPSVEAWYITVQNPKSTHPFYWWTVAKSIWIKSKDQGRLSQVIYVQDIWVNFLRETTKEQKVEKPWVLVIPLPLTTLDPCKASH